MEKQKKITQYRERLEKTLASPELTNKEILKALVKNQLLRSPERRLECQEKVVETRTAEVSNFLDMLRSTSTNHGDGPKTHGISLGDWKLKQDNEEFRVMYREGPEGTPFHTLLVEGYIDGPLDVCLCTSWETSLYMKWWPQSTVPSFKIIASDCLQKVQNNEQISLVRTKVSWPLSMREAVVHYFLFDYLKDDLIVVLLNTVPDMKSIDESIHGFTSEAIPEAEDVVRIDVVGGFALQKVNSERSYIRTIANMDIKLDFVPPALINFISRQLIGSGFRLYQKAVVSRLNSDKELGKALGEPLYAGIREALFGSPKKVEEVNILKSDTSILLKEDPYQSEEDEIQNAGALKDKGNLHASKHMQSIAVDIPIRTVSREIEEEANEEVGDFQSDGKALDYNTRKEVINGCRLNCERDVHISMEVEEALETLERVISVVQEYRFNTHTISSSSALNIVQVNTLCSTDDEQLLREMEGTSRSSQRRSSDLHHLSHTSSNSITKEVNLNRIVPASPGKKSLRGRDDEITLSSSRNNGTSEAPVLDQEATNDNDATINGNGIRSLPLNGKQPERGRKQPWYCCYLAESKQSQTKWRREKQQAEE